MNNFTGTERVLVCPLGWGLGHATRIIPIISKLIDKGCVVVVAADIPSIDILKTHFPSLNYIVYPSVNIRFNNGKWQITALFFIAIKLIFLTIKEAHSIKEIIKCYKIDFIISDNRYGLSAKGVKSVIITHQLSVIFPFPFRWAEPLGRLYIKYFLEKFNECWIPDNETEPRLSGKLSSIKNFPRNARYIGVLSRFSGYKPQKLNFCWDLVCIISGPPPHRAILESILVDLANRLNLKTLIVQGIPNITNNTIINGYVTLVPHLNDHDMANALFSAKFVICRSGYSTIMDLVTLNLRALLVPTPGQTEQEYLAKYHSEINSFPSVSQTQLKRITLSEYNSYIQK
jgi:uncharacterized protein (TIGR00661 family)